MRTHFLVVGGNYGVFVRGTESRDARRSTIERSDFAVQLRVGDAPRKPRVYLRRLAVNLELSGEQELLRRSVREFAEAEVKPFAKEIDETGRFPLDTFRKAGELGLTGICISEQY